MANGIIRNAWNENMPCWTNVWPEAVYDIRRFTMENGVTDIKKAIVDIEEQAANMNKLTESIQEELCMRIWLWKGT
jgi:hypothetical protein